MSITRRDFLKAAAAAGGGAATVAMLEAGRKAEATPVPAQWDKEADVVCIGYGGAGAVTAITAHDAGAKVLILEKMPEGGGNTAVSAGGFISPTNVEDAYT